MPENKCEVVFIQSSELSSSTKPLRVITQYSSTDDLSMQSPGRPTTLGVCLAAVQHNKDGKGGSNFARVPGLEENNQSWSAKLVDNGDFEKLLGQLGSNGSTPVTPTSFLNPRNITEDQEIFADNFSRTLNKVKAEQEGWAAAVCDHESGSHIRPHSHSPASSLHSTLPTFVNTCHTISTTSLSSKTGSSTVNSNQTLCSSNLVNPGSPGLTDQPLVLSSTSSQIHTASMPVSEIGPTHSSSKTLLPTTEFDLNRTSTNAMSSSITNTTWTTALPTIVSITSGLKDVYADYRLHRRELLEHGHQHLIPETDIPISMHVSSPEPVLFGLDSRSGVNEEKRSTDSNPGFLLHYTSISDTHTTDPTSPPNGSSATLDNQHDVPPLGTCTLPPNPTFTVHENTYPGTTSLLRSDSLLTSGLNLLPSIISTVRSPQVGLTVSSGKPSPTVAFLLTASSPTTPGRLICPTDGKHSPYAAVCARVTTANSTSSSSGSSGSGLATDVAFPRIMPTNSAMNILQDTSTGALLINSNSQLQQLTALYPGLNGTLDLATADDLQRSFTFHPNINGSDAISLNFGSALAGLSEVSMFSTSSQALTTTTTAKHDNTLSDLGHAEVTMGHSRVLSPFPRVSKESLVSEASGLDGTTTTVNTLTTMSESNGSSAGSQFTSGFTHDAATTNAKRTKRPGGGKKVRVHTTGKSNVPSNKSVCDSSTNPYLTPNQLYSSESKKFGSKRSRESCGLQAPTQPLVSMNQVNPVIFAPMQSNVSDGATYLHSSLPTQLVYLTNTDHTVHVKSEATVLGDSMDDVSTHSESISAELCGGGGGGTTTAQSGQTPPSSVDGLDQNHVKLERKRARNRVAARRCRERKISLIRALENQVAERDAHVRCLEDLLARYRSEGERLRKHMELLANSYPSLKAELYQYPFLFQQQQQHQQHNSTPTELSGLTRLSPADRASTKHFS